MPANVENSIELGHLWQQIGQFLGLSPEWLVFLQELDRNGVVFECFNRSSIQRSFTSVGRRDDQFGLIFQDVKWMGKLWLFEVSERS